MWILIYTGLCFIAGVLGIVAFITKEDNSADKLRGDQKGWEIEQIARLNEVKQECTNARLTWESAVQKLLPKLEAAEKATEKVTIELTTLKGRVEHVNQKAVAASDIAHRSLTESARQKTLELNGSVEVKHKYAPPQKRRK